MTGRNGDGERPRAFELTFDRETPASVAVVRALCAIEDVDPVNAPEELGVTLYERVDPTALDAIVGNGTGGGDVSVEVTIAGYRVVIEDTGRIRVRSSGRIG